MIRSNLEAVGINDFLEETEYSGSSDIGNVSQVCTTMYSELSLDIDEVCFVHDEAFLKYVNTKEVYDKLHKSIKSMVGAALDIYLDPYLLNKIKEEFNELKKSL